MINCIYCGKLIKVGAVTIKGDRYKCIHCNVWFEIINDKLVKSKFIKIG